MKIMAGILKFGIQFIKLKHCNINETFCDGYGITMKIGGIEKTSLIDYPEKISCVIFTIGCNFACPYCHNPALANGTAKEIHDNELAYALVGRNGFIDAVVITGGEPTLQKDLAEFCTKIKKLGYLVKLDTNGSNPAVLECLIRNGLVDYVAMDIKTTPSNYHSLIKNGLGLADKIIKSISLIMSSGLNYEFRTTCVKPFVSEVIIGDVCGYDISGATNYYIQRFKECETLDTDFFTIKNRLFSDKELEDLKLIADKYVKHCLIR